MPKRKIAIVDMQPIDPPVGGGRLRLLGLYQGLGGEEWEATYVGSFDWPGPGPRKLRLSPGLEEIDVPLSAHHFNVVERWKRRATGRNPIDVCFGFMGRLSEDYVTRAAIAIAEASVVVFSHPWIYPLVWENLTTEHVVVYDAQNFEALLRAELWDDRGAGTEVFKYVLTIERAVSQRADALLTCSPDDAKLFRDIYGVHPDCIWDVPNGVFTGRVRPADEEQKRSAKSMLGVDGPAAIFIGSAYPPNVQAVEFIAERLATTLPDITFLICGGVAEAAGLLSCRKNAPKNVRFVGLVTEEEKLRHLWAADVGLNPMFAGSGTNIKMFDFMAAGLSVVSTSVGARGIEGGQADGLFVCDAEKIAATLFQLVRGDLGRGAGEAARALAVDKYSWERISTRLGERLSTLCETGVRARPVAIARSGTHSANRASLSTSSTRQVPAVRRSRIGLISTWADRCGIAEYSRHLVEAMESRGWECFVLIYSGNSFLARRVNDGGLSVSLENVQKIQESRGLGVSAACRQAGIEQLLIQHHPGFFGEETLTGIVADCEVAGVHTVVTCHNTDQMSSATLARCANTGASIVVHNRGEVHRLERSGVRHVAYVSIGVLDAPETRTEAVRRWVGIGKSGPVIGTFGFLRRHKGFLELIEAFSLVRDIYPDSTLVAMTALYPSEESESYLSECVSLLSQKGLNQDDRVKFDIGFHEIGYVLDQLQVCDLLILPYHPSDEGASASVNVAMALRKPVITTSAGIFRDTAGSTYRIEGPDPLAIAIAICNIVSNPDLYEELQAAAETYADERNWNTVARAYENLVLKTNESTQDDLVGTSGSQETPSEKSDILLGHDERVEES
jgi:glycosyltransferase involved in cell wall biosynthesis